MKHQQLLEKLAARHLVQAMDEDLARLVWSAMTFHADDPGAQRDYVLSRLLARWNAALLATDDEVAPIYRDKVVVALATLLHKYGYAEPSITDRAIDAIDALNDAVALDDHFYRRSASFSDELQTTPTPLSRRPGQPDHTTFYRARDVISIQLDGRYYAGYVHRLARINESPIVEFYETWFSKLPTLDDLAAVPAHGERFNDGSVRVSLFSVSGIKYQPDPANQVTLIAACVPEPPDNSHLKESIGLFTVKDIFGIQQQLRGIASQEAVR